MIAHSPEHAIRRLALAEKRFMYGENHLTHFPSAYRNDFYIEWFGFPLRSRLYRECAHPIIYKQLYDMDSYNNDTDSDNDTEADLLGAQHWHDRLRTETENTGSDLDISEYDDFDDDSNEDNVPLAQLSGGRENWGAQFSAMIRRDFAGPVPGQVKQLPENATAIDFSSWFSLFCQEIWRYNIDHIFFTNGIFSFTTYLLGILGRIK